MPRRNSRYLTEPTIEKIRKPPKGQRTEISDSDAAGLALRITDKGARSWCVYFRLEDATGQRKNQRMTLGGYPAIGIAVARQQAREARNQAVAGIDPRKARAQAQTESQATAERLLFSNIAKAYVEARCQRNEQGGPKKGHLIRGSEIESIIRRHLIPAWGDKLIPEIDRLDLRDVTRPLVADKPMAAHRLHEIAKTLFYWSVNEGFLKASPFARMEAPVKKLPRDRDLKHPELKRLWAACEAKAYPFGTLVKLLALTLQRRNEVAGMQWPEFDLDKAQWTVPAERSKSKRAHIVPLSKPAVQIIKSLPRYVGGPYVLTTTEGYRPVSGFSKMKVQLDQASKVTDWRLHDLRRTGRSEMARLKVDDVVAERVLDHVPRGLAKVYNQYQYLDEKREALNLWARELRKITKPDVGEVVKLRKRA
jgi:integrase